jgi:hypothetical protein
VICFITFAIVVGVAKLAAVGRLPFRKKGVLLKFAINESITGD